MASRQFFSSFVLSSLLLGLFAAAASAADVRTWTDTSGKTLEGKFIELTDDGTVKIEANGKTYDIPLTRFSDTDKQYVESQNKPASRRGSDLMGFRQWTDEDGNEIKARYVRMVDGDVVLMQGKTGHRVDFYKLSQEDQDYLRAELTARGEAGSIPEAPAASTVGAGLIGGQPLEPGTGPSSYTAPGILPRGGAVDPNRMGNQAPSAYAPPSNDNFAAEQARRHEEARRKLEEQQEAQRQAKAEADRQRAEQQDQERMVARNTGPSMPGIHGSSVPQTEKVLICDRCNNELPPGIGAGSSCPHCGTFLASERNEAGQIVKQAEVPWYLDTRYTFGVPSWALIGFVVGVIAVIGKILS